MKAHRSGFAALIGRPNAGKSTLLNRLTGERIAIVSPKPQTTRNRILGVVTRPSGQVALLDTPGVHQAKGALNKYMMDVALAALGEVDLAVVLVDAEKANARVDPATQLVLERIAASRRPAVLGVNKVDLVKKALLLPLLDVYGRAHPFLDLIPISAKTGDGVDVLLERVLAHLPEAPPMFDPDTLTDQAERQLVAEYVREQVLKHARQEVPYATAVSVDVFDEADREPKSGPRRGPLAGLIRIAGTLYVERESQRAILIGKRGQMLKAIGTDARKAVERLLGTHVYLSLRVKVEPDWSQRADGLRKMGYA